MFEKTIGVHLIIIKNYILFVEVSYYRNIKWRESNELYSWS